MACFKIIILAVVLRTRSADVVQSILFCGGEKLSIVTSF